VKLDPYRVSKRVTYLFFYNLKKLEQIFTILAHSILKVLAFKCVHNFPPNLSCDLTLPGNTLITEYACCIPS